MIEKKLLRIGSYVRYNGEVKRIQVGSEIDLSDEYDGVIVDHENIGRIGAGSERIDFDEQLDSTTDVYHLFNRPIWWDRITKSWKPLSYSNSEDDEYDDVFTVPQFHFLHEIQNFFQSVYGVDVEYFE